MLAQPLSTRIANQLWEVGSSIGACPSPDDPLLQVLPMLFPAEDRVNTLSPGADPLEFSFSERSPRSLRFDFEPHSTRKEYSLRFRGTQQLVEMLSCAHFDSSVAGWFLQQLSFSEEGFGPFVGVEYGAKRLEALKVYLPGARVEDRAVRELLDAFPFLHPHFYSIAWTRRGPALRTYLLVRDEIRLIDLARILGTDRAVAVVDVVSALVGQTHLPQESLILGRNENSGEIKVEILCPAFPGPFEERLALQFNKRQAKVEYDRWLNAMRATSPSGSIRVNVISVHASGAEPELAVYASPMQPGG